MRIFLIFTVVLFMLISSKLWGTEMQEYTISISALEELKIEVEAKLKPDNGKIYLSNFGAWSLKDGWSKFVTIKKATNEKGEEIEFQKASRNLWKTSDSSSWITVNYIVDFSYAAEDNWPDGARAIGSYYNGEALYTIGHSLFLYGLENQENQIHLNLPKNVALFVPWTKDIDNTYRIPNMDDLLNNSLVFGKAYSKNFQAGTFNVNLLSLDQYSSLEL